MSVDSPFMDYPEFSEVMDNISRDGFQMHYRSMRILYSDDGIKWRRRWEPVILKWRNLSETWTTLVHIIRNHRPNDVAITRMLTETATDIEVKEFFARIYNNLKNLQEIEGFKKFILEKSIRESKPVMVFVEQTLEQYSLYNEKSNYFSENQAEILKDAVLDYLKCMEGIRPMLKVGGINLIPYEDFKNCVFTLKEIMEKAEFKSS